MNKKLLVAAIGAAIAAGPMMAQAEVKLYGHGHLSVDVLDNDDNPSTAPNDGGTFVSDNSSRVGIRATEDLGGGLKGVVQYELLVGGEATGTATSGGIDRTTSSPTTNRDNYIGLEGDFGAVRLGVIDSATKDIGGIADLFYREQLGESRAIIHQNFFDGRVDSGIHYFSPKFGGLSFKLQYGTEDAFRTDATEMAANVRYDAGPLTVGFGYNRVDNSAVPIPATQSDDQTGYRLAAKYDLGGGFTVAALWQSISDAGFTPGADRDTFGVGGSFKTGNNIFKVQWYSADASDNAAVDNGADQLSIGWDHLFSKTTKGYVTYAKTSNDDAGTFGVGGAGHGESATPAAGGDASGFSIGMIVDF